MKKFTKIIIPTITILFIGIVVIASCVGVKNQGNNNILIQIEIDLLDLFNNHLNHPVIVYDATNQSHPQRMSIVVVPPVRI
jgi:hypothetical protein